MDVLKPTNKTEEIQTEFQKQEDYGYGFFVTKKVCCLLSLLEQELRSMQLFIIRCKGDYR